MSHTLMEWIHLESRLCWVSGSANVCVTGCDFLHGWRQRFPLGKTTTNWRTHWEASTCTRSVEDLGDVGDSTSWGETCFVVQSCMGPTVPLKGKVTRNKHLILDFIYTYLGKNLLLIDVLQTLYILKPERSLALQFTGAVDITINSVNSNGFYTKILLYGKYFWDQ